MAVGIDTYLEDDYIVNMKHRSIQFVLQNLTKKMFGVFPIGKIKQSSEAGKYDRLQVKQYKLSHYSTILNCIWSSSCSSSTI